MKRFVAVVLVVVGMAGGCVPLQNQVSAGGKTHELNLTVGERFQVVCREGAIIYGDNGRNGIVGVCAIPND